MQASWIVRIGRAVCYLILWQGSAMAQTNVLPRAFEVYGGTIGVIDAIQVPGETSKTRVFASTDSANSVFYADVDHASPTPLGTNFVFTVVPDLDANANYGAPDWIAAHQPSARVFVGSSSGLLSCTTSRGSLVTNIAKAISFVLIQGSNLFAVSDAVDERVTRTLYYGTLNSSGNLTSSSLTTNFYGQHVTLAISPVDNKVYVLCTFQTNCVLLKSSDNYNAFRVATTFSQVPTAGVTLQEVSQVTVGPDGRLFLGGGSTYLQLAISDDEGGSWTNFSVAGRSGGSEQINIVCNGVSNAYEVYYGWMVSSNKGAAVTWAELPRGGSGPQATHVNAGCIKIDPLDSSTIYVTTDKGIGGSTNAGADVVELNNGLLAFQINDIDALADKSIAWIGSKAGMRRATSFNTTPVWTDGDFPDAIVYACTIDKDDPTGMTGYAGSCRLYKTTTGGGTNASAWVQVFRWEDYIFSDGEIRSVKAQGSFVALGYFSYAQTSPSGGVWISSNGGTNWTATLTNVNVNDMLMKSEGSVDVLYVATSKSMPAERGGIYRSDSVSGSMTLDMTNEINIRKLAEDSVGGIYASGTLPETSMPNRYHVVAYYRDTNSTWSLLPTNGLPGDFSDGDILGRGLGPVITVGKDSATNDVPVLACQRTIYYLPNGGSSWVTVTNYPNGTQIKTLFYDELMVGTTIGLYSQGLNAEPETATLAALTGDYDGDGKADPALYVASTGNWYVKLSGSSYALVTLPFGGPGYAAVDGDFDGDGKADPAIYQESAGLWQVQLSGSGYAVATMTGFGGSDHEAVAGDYDGDGKADPAIYCTTSGDWQVAMSSLGYGLASAAGFGGTGYTAVQENYDSDQRFDAAVYNTANGNWTVLLSAQNYITGTLWGFGGAGYAPVSGDFDGDGRADPMIYQESTATWSVKLSSQQYATATLAGFGGHGYGVTAADFDGDRKADPTLFDTATGIWHIKLSASGYIEATLASGYTP